MLQATRCSEKSRRNFEDDWRARRDGAVQTGRDWPLQKATIRKI